MRIAFADPRSLRPNPRNGRAIRDDRFADLLIALEASPDMLEARPLIQDLEVGDIVAGNQRLAGILELLDRGAPRLTAYVAEHGGVPVYLKLFANDAERREWHVRDNADYGDWIPAELAAIVAAQQADGADMRLLGFTSGETDALLALAQPDPILEGGHADPDHVPEPPPEPRTRPGDVYELGEHVLICGDATDPAVIGRLLNRHPQWGAVLTDPPYGIDLDTDYSSMRGFGQGGIYDLVTGDTATAAVTIVEQAAHHLKGIAEQWWFGADYYTDALATSWAPGAWAVWDKRRETSDNGFGSGFELIASRARHQRVMLRHFWFGMFGEDAEARNRVHPTQKPTALLMDIIERWAPPGAIVDPFGGSGSTLIACERLERPCLMLEVEPAYCDVIVDRYAAFTGSD